MFTFTVNPIAKTDLAALYGHIVKIGNDEKRRAENVVTVFDGMEYTHYIMFYKGLENLLIKACKAIAAIVNSPADCNPVEYKRNYKALIDCLWIVNHHSTAKRHSKLDGIKSLSTCCLNNKFCRARMLDKCSVCSHCYAASQQKVQHGLTEHNVINGLILQNVGIPTWAWQEYKGKAIALETVFRIESFGDVSNLMQIYNYISLCRAFPSVNFAAWSKNVAMWLAAFDTIGKPENLSFVTSSNHVNKCDDWKDSRIDHTFTVYDKKGVSDQHIVINCGGRACKECIAKKIGCYYKGKDKHIRELLK